jgi:diguanylate cyclase (GGDEF)-like protein/PAS domain S-box-containing protein
MISRIIRWFAPPIFIGNDEKTRRAEVLNSIIITAIAFSVLAILGDLLGGLKEFIFYIINLLVISTSLLMYYWLRRGRTAFVGIWEFISGFIYITWAVASLGTIRVPTTGIYIFLVIIAEVMYGLKGILVSTIACSLAVLGLILAENAGLLPQPSYAVTITQWITYTILFAAVGSLTYSSGRITNQALSRSQKEVAERRRAEDALRESDARWHFALEGTGDGLWDWDAQTNTVYFSRQWKAMLGYAPAEIGSTLDEWDSRVHPADREQVYAELQHILTEGAEFYSSEHRVRCKDGSYKWILDRGKVISRAPGGAPLRVIGTHTDITERKNAEVALRESEARFRSLFEQTHDAVFILDLEGRHLAANQRAADMLGYTFEEVLGLSVHEVSAEINQSGSIMDHLLAGEQVPAYERLFRKKDGQVFPVEINVELVRDKNGAPMHLISVVNDISQRKLAEEAAQKAADALKKANEQLSLRVAEVENLQAELREQALHDPLTGLFNRRYLSEAMEREIARARRENEPLSVIVSDIDFFKMINDTYGHQVGDRFLTEIARLMKQFTRGSDTVCRYGGEEFLLVLPRTTAASAAKRAEELRKMCAETVMRHDGQDVRVSMSFGIAAYPDHGQQAEEIIIKADKALYQSKHTGRNRVTIWRPESSA